MSKKSLLNIVASILITILITMGLIPSHSITARGQETIIRPCIANDYYLRGQQASSYRVGTSDDSDSATAPSSEEIIDIPSMAGEMSINFSEFSGASVVILVIDDFSDPTRPSHGYAVKGILDYWYTSLLAGKLEAIGYSGVPTADVQAVIQSLIMSGELEATAIPTIVIDAVDISSQPDDDFQEDFLRDVIDTQLANYAGFDYIIFNMSFVLIPCGTDEFRFSDFLSIHLDDTDFSLLEFVGGEEQLNNLLLNPMLDDTDFYFYLADLAESGTSSYAPNRDGLATVSRHQQSASEVILVASAGNFGNYGSPYAPYAPARWSEVTSVAATLGTTGSLWEKTNGGDVEAPGGYYYAGSDGPDDLYWIGTSFSAPYYALQLALELLR